MKNKLHLLIGIIIAVGAIYFTFKNISFQELYVATSTIQYMHLIPVLIFIAVTFIFRAYRWKYLASALKDIKVTRFYSPLMIGFMGNMLPARAGEFIRAYLLGKRENISLSSSFATIFVERMFDVLAMLSLASVFLFIDLETFSQVQVSEGISIIALSRKFGIISVFTCVAIILFSLAMVFYKKQVLSVITFLTAPCSEKIREKIISLTNSFSEGFMVLKNLKNLFMVIFFTILVWTVNTLSYYSFFKMFGLENLPFTALPVTMVMICIFIALLPTPGYVGSFQAGCVIALHNMFNVSEATAVSFGMVSWFINMAFVILTGTFFIVKDNISLKKTEEKE